MVRVYWIFVLLTNSCRGQGCLSDFGKSFRLRELFPNSGFNSRCRETVPVSENGFRCRRTFPNTEAEKDTPPGRESLRRTRSPPTTRRPDVGKQLLLCWPQNAASVWWPSYRGPGVHSEPESGPDVSRNKLRMMLGPRRSAGKHSEGSPGSEEHPERIPGSSRERSRNPAGAPEKIPKCCRNPRIFRK